MATLLVPSQHATIADAMAAAQPGDIIVLDTGYADESASVTVDNITVQGDASNTGIVLTLATGIAQVTLAGSAPIDVAGNDGANTIVGNAGINTLNGSDGDDVIDSGAGVDDVDGGGGSDRLIVDYSAASTHFGGAIVGGSLADGYQGGWRDAADSSVDFSGIETFAITTGSGNDIVGTGDGDDMIVTGAGNDDIAAGGGDDTIDAGTGSDLVDGGAGTDRLIVDYSGASLSVTFQVTGGSAAAGLAAVSPIPSMICSSSASKIS